MKCPRCGGIFYRTPSIWKCFDCGFYVSGKEVSKFDRRAGITKEAWADFDRELAALIEKGEFGVNPGTKEIVPKKVRAHGQT